MTAHSAMTVIKKINKYIIMKLINNEYNEIFCLIKSCQGKMYVRWGSAPAHPGQATPNVYIDITLITYIIIFISDPLGFHPFE